MNDSSVREATETETASLAIRHSVLHVRFKPGAREQRDSTLQLIEAAGALDPDRTVRSLLVDCTELQQQTPESRDLLLTYCMRSDIARVAVVAPGALSEVLGSALLGIEAKSSPQLEVFRDTQRALGWIASPPPHDAEPPRAASARRHEP